MGFSTGTGTGMRIPTCEKPIPIVTGHGFTKIGKPIKTFKLLMLFVQQQQLRLLSVDFKTQFKSLIPFYSTDFVLFRLLMHTCTQEHSLMAGAKVIGMADR